MSLITLKCTCGAIIPDSNIDEWESVYTNEEGEEWAKVAAHCDNCGKDWEATTWGQIDDIEEAKEILPYHTSLTI